MKDKFKNRFLDGKRLMLVIDDEIIRCETIHYLLSKEYRVITADNAEQAMRMIRENIDKLSLIMLDVTMKGVDGFALLKAIKDDEELRYIPVIVMTREKSYEVKCLQYGASDFIAKPCELPDAVLARVRRSIQDSENSYLLHNTEMDPLTGILNMEYFFEYAERYDKLHPKKRMDAVSVDISHFHIINELYGREDGNKILIKLAEELKRIVIKQHGLVCRKAADVFLMYLPHRRNYSKMLSDLQEAITEADKYGNTLRLKMGIYLNVDKSVDIRTRFDRAKLARDTIHYSYSQIIAYYDGALHQQNLISQQLMREMDAALENKEFKVYFQPKYDIKGEEPVLVSAEALVRWQHPKMGLIYPGVFIPLFEDNGLISKLDRYVWEETAARIHEWRERFGFSLPVSVNVSRIDMFDPELEHIFSEIMRKNALDPADLIIEITESAYTDNSAQIIEQVNRLRSLGFKIEMDDFGSGYSSLNMLSILPIDAIKLDMSFIRNVFGSEKNLQLLRLMMQIKDFLHVPIIAEGVETADQLSQLRDIGCDIAQGYYFSKPVPSDAFSQLLQESRPPSDRSMNDE